MDSDSCANGRVGILTVVLMSAWRLCQLWSWHGGDLCSLQLCSCKGGDSELCLLQGRDSNSCAHGRGGIVTVVLMAGWGF